MSEKNSDLKLQHKSRPDSLKNRELYPHLNFPITALALPKKIEKKFWEMGIELASDIGPDDILDLINIPGIGLTTATNTKKILQENCFFREPGRDIHCLLDDFQELFDYIPKDIVLLKINRILLNEELRKDKDVAEILFASTEFRELLEKYLLQRLADYTVVDINECKGYLPKVYGKEVYISEIFEDLIKKKKIKKDDSKNTVEKVYITVEEYLETIKKDVNKAILRKRLRNKTLEEIGNDCSITRERVRQILNMIFKEMPKMHEDRYKYLFTNYLLSVEDFVYGFGKDENNAEIAYYYLNARYKKGKRKIEEAVRDTKLDCHQRNAAEKIQYKDYLDFKGKKIKKDRNELVKYILHENAHDKAITFSELKEIYAKVLDDFGIENNDKFNIDKKSVSNRLRESPFLLYTTGEKLRYYNIPERDFMEFLNEINLFQYKDVQISALKIYNTHSELMHEYDIQDENELHNLLKKICTEKKADPEGKYRELYPEIDFGRMPTLKFGNVSIEQQAEKLLMQSAPISMDDFVRKYAEEYAYDEKTIKANMLEGIKEYLDETAEEKIYKLDYPMLNDSVMSQFKENLQKDFYFIDELKELYKKLFPDLDLQFFNSYTIKKLGYNIYMDYIISKKYNNAVDYFKHILLKDDFLDINNFPRRLPTLVQFYVCLDELRHEYEIVEYDYRKYINIRKLEESGISKEDLKAFCQLVKNAIEEDKYFTISYLEKKGLELPFRNKLPEKVAQEWFYSSILMIDRKNFSYTRIGRNRLFIKNAEEKGVSVRWGDLISRKVTAHPKKQMTIKEIQNMLKDVYNIELDPYKIIANVKDSRLFYSEVNATVYADFNCYTGKGDPSDVI